MQNLCICIIAHQPSWRFWNEKETQEQNNTWNKSCKYKSNSVKLLKGTYYVTFYKIFILFSFYNLHMLENLHNCNNGFVCSIKTYQL